MPVLVAWICGCDLPGRPRPADRYVPPQEERAFGVLFQKHCAGCHGALGKLGPAPPLNEKLFLALVPDDELKGVIAHGRAGTLMPAFAVDRGGPLLDVQIEVLAKSIKAQWGSEEGAPAGAPPYRLEEAKARSPGYGDRDSGAKIFQRACATCHGDSGQGAGDAGMNAGPINDRAFLALISDQALRRIIITGRPDLGMPNYADPNGRPDGFQPLSAQDVADITALLAHWREATNQIEKGK